MSPSNTTAKAKRLFDTRRPNFLASVRYPLASIWYTTTGGDYQWKSQSTLPSISHTAQPNKPACPFTLDNWELSSPCPTVSCKQYLSNAITTINRCIISCLSMLLVRLRRNLQDKITKNILIWGGNLSETSRTTDSDKVYGFTSMSLPSPMQKNARCDFGNVFKCERSAECIVCYGVWRHDSCHMRSTRNLTESTPFSSEKPNRTSAQVWLQIFLIFAVVCGRNL